MKAIITTMLSGGHYYRPLAVRKMAANPNNPKYSKFKCVSTNKGEQNNVVLENQFVNEQDQSLETFL